MRKLNEGLIDLVPARASNADKPPPMRDVLMSSIDIMQVRIARSRLAGDPPDILVSPRLGHFHALDFHRAREAIEEGKRATEVALLNMLGVGNHSS